MAFCVGVFVLGAGSLWGFFVVILLLHIPGI